MKSTNCKQRACMWYNTNPLSSILTFCAKLTYRKGKWDQPPVHYMHFYHINHEMSCIEHMSPCDRLVYLLCNWKWICCMYDQLAWSNTDKSEMFMCKPLWPCGYQTEIMIVVWKLSYPDDVEFYLQGYSSDIITKLLT